MPKIINEDNEISVIMDILKLIHNNSSDINTIEHAIDNLFGVEINKNILKKTNVKKIIKMFTKNSNLTVAEKAKALIYKWKNDLKEQSAKASDTMPTAIPHMTRTNSSEI